MIATRYKNGTAVKRTSLTSDIGDTGLRQNFGRITDDFLRDWQTTSDKVKNVNKMLKNSPMIGGALRLAIEMSIRKVDWTLTSDSGKDDPDLELVNAAWANLSTSWNDHIADAMLMPFYGWSMFAEIYERVDGRLLWRKFKMLGHDTVDHWLFADDGGLAGLQQWYYMYPEPIPVERMLIYRFRNNRNNPEGESILRPAWTSFYYGTGLEEGRAIALERLGPGFLVVSMPRGADPSESGEDYKKAALIVRNTRNDEAAGIVKPPPTGETEADKWHIEFLNTGNAAIITSFNEAITSYEQKQLMAALAQFITLGMNRTGTQAKAESDVGFFTMAVDAMADIISETFTKYAIDRLLVLNGRTPGTIKLEHSPAGDVDTETLLKLITASGLKITQTAEDEVWLRSIFDMPAKTVEEIEEARQENEDKRQAIAGQFLQRPPATNEPEPDENTAVIYATNSDPDHAPDERDRRRMERQWLATMRGYLDKAQGRVVKGARGMSK